MHPLVIKKYIPSEPIPKIYMLDTKRIKLNEKIKEKANNTKKVYMKLFPQVDDGTTTLKNIEPRQETELSKLKTKTLSKHQQLIPFTLSSLSLPIYLFPYCRSIRNSIRKEHERNLFHIRQPSKMLTSRLITITGTLAMAGIVIPTNGHTTPTTTNNDAQIHPIETPNKSPSSNKLETWPRKEEDYNYVLPGTQLELFDENSATQSFFKYPKPLGPIEKNTLIQNKIKLTTYLAEMAKQNNLIYAGRMKPPNGISMRAKNLYSDILDISAKLNKIHKVIEHLSEYFMDDTDYDTDPDCTLTIPSTNLTLGYARLEDILEGEKLQNTDTNSKYSTNEDGDREIIKGPNNIPTLTLGQVGNALLHTEIAVDQANRIATELEKDITEEQETIESLVNKRIPPNVLAGMDLTMGCVQKGRQDNIRMEKCAQSENNIICKAEILKRGEGIETYKIVPIPYYKDGKTLALTFPDHLVYKKGTGKTYDITGCHIIGSQARCQGLAIEANACLEELVSRSDILNKECEVEEIPENRPLVISTLLGTLVAQQSDTTLVAEYRDRAISQDPFVLDNTDPFEIWYGSERIKIPSIEEGHDTLMIPKGKFEALNAIAEIKNWREKWEKLLPINQRQILLLSSVALQILLTIPALVSLVDIIMRGCGYDLLPRAQRSVRRRYESRKNSEDPELGETGFFLDDDPSIRSILHTPKSRQSFRSSMSRDDSPTPSDRSRIRIENQRVLERD